MRVAVEVRESEIGGKGCFAAEAVKRGTIVCFYAEGGRIIDESTYVKGLEAGDAAMTRTGTRWAGRWFVYGAPASTSNYINHSFEPNLLAHCGVFFARRGIAVGEEFTVDYRHFIDESDVGVYTDSATGREIRGFGPRESMLATTRELLGIIESDEGWTG